MHPKQTWARGPLANYRQIKLVHSLEELVATPFAHGVNALCWPRELAGDFDEVAMALGRRDGIFSIETDDLNGLSFSEAGRIARDVLLQDQRALREHDLDPSLDLICDPPRDRSGGPVSRDVFSWHVDSATDPVDTYLCSYNTAFSEGLPNEQAMRCVDVPEIRGQLQQLFGSTEPAGFEEFLSDNCYNLHYVPLPAAQPFPFGIGHLWRIATDHPGCLVPPCIHRAPEIVPGRVPRLLLIS